MRLFVWIASFFLIKYYFYTKDHLGNNRVVTDKEGTAVQSNQYYPFGMLYANSIGSDKQPYKYSSKELDNLHGLDLYDSQARWYSGSIPGFTTQDPMSEKYYGWSSYGYCAGNPLKYIDPTGTDTIPAIIAEQYWSRFDINNDIISLPTVTVEGKPVWEQQESGGIISVFNNYTNQRVVLGEKPLETVYPEFGILIASRLLYTAGAIVTDTEMTTVGRWMSKKEYEIMVKTGKVVEGGGGQTFVATGGSESFKGAAKGSVYAEFDIPTSSLLQGGKADWFKVIGPKANKSMQKKLIDQGGEILPSVKNLTKILKTK